MLLRTNESNSKLNTFKFSFLSGVLDLRCSVERTQLLMM